MSGPKEMDGKKVEGNFLSHQVIFEDVAENPEHLKILREWLESYKISELISFDQKGEMILDQDIKDLIPEIFETVGNSPFVNGHNMKDLKLPEALDYFKEREFAQKEDNVKKENSMFYGGQYLRDVMKENDGVRLFSPDETYSNRLQAVFEATKRQWQFPIKKNDIDYGKSGKVIEILSEHLLFGMLWGYTLSGRRGFFASYESFAQIVASMVDQYVKFLNAGRRAEFRGDVPSLNIILSSLLERQDHNGYSHQNPSLISNNLDRDLDILNVYFPVDKNIMTLTMEKVLQGKKGVNIIVAGKKMTRTWFSREEAKKLVNDGLIILDKISDENPDLVVATAGDYVTEEAIVGLKLFKERFPQIKVRFVNFFKLDILLEENKSISNQKILEDYLTEEGGIVFNYHGYESDIKKLLFGYNLSERIIINGYRESGSTTSPFDMKARNGLSRFHLVANLADLAQRKNLISADEFNKVLKEMENFLIEEKEYIIKNKVDPDWIKNW